MDQARSAVKSGQRYIGIPVTVKDVVVVERPSANLVVVRVVGSQSAARVVDVSGKTVQSISPRRIDLAFDVLFEDGWKVQQTRKVTA